MTDFILDLNVQTDSSNGNYKAFFFEAVNSGKVVVVYGGTKYLGEVAKKAQLEKLIRSWRIVGRAKKVSSERIDRHESLLKQEIESRLGGVPKCCDDLHIVALAQVSGCVNVFSHDVRMVNCRDQTRDVVGHDLFPRIRIINNEAVFKTHLT